MERKQDGFVPLGDVVAGVELPDGRALTPAAPRARHHFTRLDQIDQLVDASEADADLGFMARMMMLCSVPRANPGDRLQFKRVNGPYRLVMFSSGETKLPYGGNIPRLLLAWVCTEAVRTQSHVITLGDSLSEFMRKVGVYSTSGGTTGGRTRLRNQMKRLFRCQIELITGTSTASVRSRHGSPTAPSCGGANVNQTSARCGRARSSSARSSFRRSSRTRFRSTYTPSRRSSGRRSASTCTAG